jgi:hypothetical protein
MATSTGLHWGRVVRRRILPSTASEKSPPDAIPIVLAAAKRVLFYAEVGIG